MNVQKMTTQHIKNKIAYLERFLNARPPEACYGGDSDGAMSAIECENRRNETLAGDVREIIVGLNKELKHRGGGDR